MDMSIFRSRFAILLLVAAIYMIHGKNARSAEISIEDVLMFKDYTAELMSGILRGMEYKAEIDTPLVISQTKTGKEFVIIPIGARKEIEFSAKFALKKELDPRVRIDTFVAICKFSDNVHVSVHGENNSMMIVTHTIPMEFSKVSAGHFIESLLKYLQAVQKIEAFGRENDVFGSESDMFD